MHRRTEVVMKAGQRQFESAGGAAGLRLGFVDIDVQTCLSQDDSRCQAFWTGADYASASRHACKFRVSGFELQEWKSSNHKGHKSSRRKTGGDLFVLLRVLCDELICASAGDQIHSRGGTSGNWMTPMRP